MSFCSVAAYSFTGIMTSPKEIEPFHMLRMTSPYPVRSGPDHIRPDPAPGTGTSSVVRILLFGNMFDVPSRQGAPRMSDMNIERPEADSAEQDQDAIPGSDATSDAERDEVPLEANDADTAEQDREVSPGEEEYR
jgi:hypothetical protein